MDKQARTPLSGLKNNKGKFGVLAIYTVVVLLSPLIPEPEFVVYQDKGFVSQAPYLVLAMVLASFIVYTAFHYIRVSSQPRWVVFLVILFGSVYFTFFGTQDNPLIAIHAGFHSAVDRTQAGAWFYTILIPIGAICYWFRLRYKEVQNISDEKHT